MMFPSGVDFTKNKLRQQGSAEKDLDFPWGIPPFPQFRERQ
jgi:hypothetical protein